MKTYKHVAVVLAAAVLASGGGIAASVMTAAPAHAASTQAEVDTAVAQILRETNAERAKVGLAPLTLAPTMNTVAQNWTQKMATNSQLDHNLNFTNEIHPTWTKAAENIANGYLLNNVMSGWMNSPGHKANILGDYTHIGIGYWVDANGYRWYTQNFGKYPTANTPPSLIGAPVTTPSPTEVMTVWYNFNREYITDYKAEIYSSTGQLLESKTLNKADVDETVPSYIFKALKPNTTYTIKLTANTTNVMGARLSSPVRTVQVTTTQGPEAPNAPEALSATTPTYDTMFSRLDSTVSWKAPTGVIGTVDYYVVTVKAAGQPDRTYTTTATAYKLTGLSENTDYTIQVTAKVIGVDNRTIVDSPAANLPLKTPIVSSAQASSPTLVSAAGVTHNEATVSWKTPTTVAGTIESYTVEVSPGPGQSFSNIYYTTGTSYKLVGLASNHNYTITVKANAVSLDKAQRVTSVGTTTTFTTTTAPVLSPIVKVSAPVVTVGGIGADRMTVSWAKPAVTGTIKGYKVTVKAGTRVVQTHSLNAATYSKQILALAENTTYTVVVDAIAVAPNGINTAVASTVKLVKTPLSAASTVRVAPPAALATAVSRTAVTATWRKPAVTGKIVNYTVTLKQGTRVIKTIVTATGKQSFTGLRANTAYTVTVQANAISLNGKYKASAAVSKAFRTLR